MTPKIGGDRVEREQQVRGADGEQYQEHRCQHAAPAEARDDLAAVVPVGEGQPATGEGDEAVVLHRRVLVAVAEELHRGEQEQQPEQQEHEREGGQQGRAQRDEDRAQDQGEDDPEGQHPLLVLGRHRERRHDDHEDEEVVDRQALLDDVAGEVLGAVVPPGERPEDDAEADRHPDVEHRPGDGLAESHGVGAPSAGRREIEDEERDDERDRRRPGDKGHVEHGRIMDVGGAARRLTAENDAATFSPPGGHRDGQARGGRQREDPAGAGPWWCSVE